MSRSVRRIWLAAVAVGMWSPPPAVPQGDTTLAAGEHYRAGGLHRLLFGRHYRALWATPLRVPVLDLRTFGGGLTPTTAGGGFQTKSLRFRGGDGYEYGFRSVDKDPSVLPPELAGTFIEDIVRDQTSAQHPGSPAVAASLMSAVGVLHADPHLVVLPDDSLLGEFRERFAGTLGFIERRAIVEPGVPPFAGAAEIIDGRDILELARRGPTDRVEPTSFLYARLLDLWIGDWDRHAGNWGWARFGDSAVTQWVPVPEDRDQAFVRFDGVLLSLARVYAPQLVSFGPEYPTIVGLTWNGRGLDRQFLPELEREVWDSVTAALVSRLGDSVIDAAARALPAEYYAIDGERIARALRARRDALPEAADRFYRLLADQVDVFGTDADEEVSVVREEGGAVQVTIGSTVDGRQTPFFRRRFLPGETGEVRLYLFGGADRVTVVGPGSGITIRVIGDSGDVVENRSGTGILWYGDLEVRGAGRVDRRPFPLPPADSRASLPPRDWGRRWRWVVWAESAPDVGLFVGGGRHLTTYGFRKVPYSASVRMRGGFSTGGMTGRADLVARLHRTNSRAYLQVQALASGIEVLRYYGVGNETVVTERDDYYRVAQREVTLAPELVLPAGDAGRLGFGPVVRHSRTLREPDRIIAALEPYGSEGFGQIGLRGWFELDSRDVPAAARRGARLAAGGSVYPAVWDVRQGAFGELHAEASAYFSAEAAPLVPTLALRAGGKRVWGTYPYREAAYLGDAASVRLGAKHRLGGDAAVYGNAELRLQLARMSLLLPGHVGVFGLGDVGRVFVANETSSRWHWAVGGGVWLAYLQRVNTLSLAVAKSREDVAVYVQAGFAY